MKAYYNPLDKACKSFIGAVPRGGEVTFNVYKSKSGEENFFSADICTFVLQKDGEETNVYSMLSTEFGWSITLKIHTVGLYFYYFRFADGMSLGCGKLRTGELSYHPISWQLTVFAEDFVTPDWFKGGVMYQIFPDRFHKTGTFPSVTNKILREDWGGLPRFRPDEFGKVLNNDFFGGNLNGIREKLGYLKSLNVTVIYLNPIFEAYSNHRYDTGDYMKIDKLLGTEDDFDALVSDAEQLGIRIILDGVFNHTGVDSRYFNKYGRYSDSVGAYQSRLSPYYDWYRFNEYPERYESWWGIETLPSVNENAESYQQFIFGEYGVLKNWLRHGIGGYRIDVADELPDFFIQKMRRAVKSENKDAILIGEVWEDASNKIAYSERRQYLQGSELDSVMNYPLRDAIIQFAATGKTEYLRETISMLIDNYPKQVVDCQMNILGTHDTARILTVLSGRTCCDKEEMAITRLSEQEKRDAKQKLKIAALLQYTLPGVPCVYYGDESGMEGFIDPFCRACFDWENIDKEIFDFYERLGEIRKSFVDIFAEGVYREMYADNGCLVFERKTEHDCVYVFVNHLSNEYSVKLNGRYTDVLNRKDFCGIIPGHSYGILVQLCHA